MLVRLMVIQILGPGDDRKNAIELAAKTMADFLGASNNSTVISPSTLLVACRAVRLRDGDPRARRE